MEGTEKNKALKYAEEALTHFLQHKDNRVLAMAYDTLGYVQHKFYSTLDDLKKSKTNFILAGERDPNKADYFKHQQDVQKTINEIS